MKFNKGAGGLHHIAIEVPDIAAASAAYEAQGFRMVEPAAVKGAGDFLCNFLMPSATRGIITELVQPLPPRLTARPRRKTGIVPQVR